MLLGGSDFHPFIREENTHLSPTDGDFDIATGIFRSSPFNLDVTANGTQTRMTEDLREPVHRRFVIIDDYEHERKYEGIEIPYRWQAWETANFFRIDSILDPGNEKMPVRLISYGCNNGDPERLNCTETCSNRTLMYNSPENLWNCMTLATMAMVIVPGDDTIDEATEEEAAEKFGFGSLEEFNKLNVFTSVRNCVWASCSDSAYGKCTSSLHRFQCTRIHPDNIASFGRVLEGPYCQAADAGIDFDIAGQGVSISHVPP